MSYFLLDQGTSTLLLPPVMLFKASLTEDDTEADTVGTISNHLQSKGLIFIRYSLDLLSTFQSTFEVYLHSIRYRKNNFVCVVYFSVHME